jgi:GntR family transcriptional repressor for pyruvate dehydrogenase complex
VFNFIRCNKASEEIIFQIRKQIFAGKLVPGDKLPKESELMGQFNVSKQTLREALRALEFVGLIEIRKGKTGGAFIAEMESKIALDILANYLYFKNLSGQNLADVRRLIEPHAAYIAATEMSTAEIAHLAEVVESTRQDYKAGRMYDVDCNSDLEFHCVIARGTKNPLFILIVEFIESLMSDKKRVVRPDDDFLASILSSHEKIYDAISKRDAERARQEMHDHITEVEKKIHKLQGTVF